MISHPQASTKTNKGKTAFMLDTRAMRPRHGVISAFCRGGTESGEVPNRVVQKGDVTNQKNAIGAWELCGAQLNTRAGARL